MRKWKIAFIFAANAALMYAIFLACIQQPKSAYRQVEDLYGDQAAILKSQESALLSIALSSVSNPTTITIEEVHPERKAVTKYRRSLDSSQAAKLIMLINGK